MRVDIRQIDSDRLLEQSEVEVLADRSFLVLQCRHRYRLRNGIDELASLALQVKTQRQPADARWWQGGWLGAHANEVHEEPLSDDPPGR